MLAFQATARRQYSLLVGPVTELASLLDQFPHLHAQRLRRFTSSGVEDMYLRPMGGELLTHAQAEGFGLGAKRKMEQCFLIHHLAGGNSAAAGPAATGSGAGGGAGRGGAGGGGGGGPTGVLRGLVVALREERDGKPDKAFTAQIQVRACVRACVTASCSGDLYAAKLRSVGVTQITAYRALTVACGGWQLARCCHITRATDTGIVTSWGGPVSTMQTALQVLIGGRRVGEATASEAVAHLPDLMFTPTDFEVDGDSSGTAVVTLLDAHAGYEYGRFYVRQVGSVRHTHYPQGTVSEACRLQPAPCNNYPWAVALCQCVYIAPASPLRSGTFSSGDEACARGLRAAAGGGGHCSPTGGFSRRPGDGAPDAAAGRPRGLPAAAQGHRHGAPCAGGGRRGAGGQGLRAVAGEATASAERYVLVSAPGSTTSWPIALAGHGSLRARRTLAPQLCHRIRPPPFAGALRHLRNA